MHERILQRLREKIRRLEYVATVHAEEEMDKDDLTIHEVEHCILTGNILEGQQDEVTGEWKYRIQGETPDGERIESIAKLGPTGKAVIITVYRL